MECSACNTLQIKSVYTPLKFQNFPGKTKTIGARHRVTGTPDRLSAGSGDEYGVGLSRCQTAELVGRTSERFLFSRVNI